MLRLPYRAFPNVKVAARLVPPGGPSIRYRPLIAIRIVTTAALSGSVLIGDAFADPGSDLTIVRMDMTHSPSSNLRLQDSPTHEGTTKNTKTT
jgi:hypothetical protein